MPVSATVTLPAGSTAFVPTTDQKSALGWIGAVQAPALCGANAMRNTGGMFNVTVQASTHTGQLAFQFQLPRARCQGEATDCTVSGVVTTCQAKWSSTGLV